MNGTVREWVDKGEADYVTAKRELAAVDGPNYDAVCYHAQQCIEKLMKALLIHCGVTPARTHNLMWLDKLLRPVAPDWSASEDELDFLTRAGVVFRYPGSAAEIDDANEAIAICGRMREKLLRLVSEE